MIVGITGKFCAGKDTTASILKESGFMHISLSDILREKLQEKNGELTRENLANFGNELREKHGAGYLARQALRKIEPQKDYVVTSIRNPTEAEVLKAHPNFTLIAIDASPEVRFQRNKLRARAEDAKLSSYEEFLKSERAEETSDPNKQQLSATFKMADMVISNEKTIDGLKESVNEALSKLKLSQRKPRPDWDEYFTELSRTVGLRGTCDRGKSGSVIVKDKRIISTGYVGAPAGLPHCDEVGHLMNSVTNGDGTVSSHCIRTTHAEQNAIVQAAKHGISIDGATLYCRMEPCHVCAKMIVNAGIRRVVAERMYQKAEFTREMFRQAGIEMTVLDKQVEAYPASSATGRNK